LQVYVGSVVLAEDVLSRRWFCAERGKRHSEMTQFLQRHKEGEANSFFSMIFPNPWMFQIFFCERECQVGKFLNGALQF
jgi:hypothetical protein